MRGIKCDSSCLEATESTSTRTQWTRTACSTIKIKVTFHCSVAHLNVATETKRIGLFGHCREPRFAKGVKSRFIATYHKIIGLPVRHIRILSHNVRTAKERSRRI